jgi:hypothetical protein
VIASDPAIGSPMNDDELDDTLATLGDYADLKSPWWAGHSRGVGDLAGQAAATLGLPADIVRPPGVAHPRATDDDADVAAELGVAVRTLLRRRQPAERLLAAS